MFATAEQAALFYARREAGRDTSDLTAPPPPPPPPAPSSAAGAEAVRQAEREGLTLATSGNSTGYKGMSFCPKQSGSKLFCQHCEEMTHSEQAQQQQRACVSERRPFCCW